MRIRTRGRVDDAVKKICIISGVREGSREGEGTNR
jgi:hypothetical protein